MPSAPPESPAAAPTPSLPLAPVARVATAAAGDTVNVEAGNYADGAVTLNKVLTVNGAAPVSGALGYSFTLGTADSLALAGNAAINATLCFQARAGRAGARDLGRLTGRTRGACRSHPPFRWITLWTIPNDARTARADQLLDRAPRLLAHRATPTD